MALGSLEGSLKQVQCFTGVLDCSNKHTQFPVPVPECVWRDLVLSVGASIHAPLSEAQFRDYPKLCLSRSGSC